jgi:hypothetical protein
LTLGWWTALDGSPESVGEWGRQFWHQYAPMFVVSMLVLPLVLLDLLIMSNRYAGPLLRLRRVMKQLANSEPVAPIRLRRRDLMQEFAEDFNKVLRRVQNQATATVPHTEIARENDVQLPDQPPQLDAVSHPSLS